MEQLIKKIYETRTVYNDKDEPIALESSIDAGEGKFLLGLVERDPDVRKTLEIGCAHGLSTLHICQGLKGRTNASHIMIDPFQAEEWGNVGISNAKRAGYNFASLIEEKSEFALPEILRDGEGKFDLIFIDGFHTFDQALLDAYYANRLLRRGGYLVFDDCTMASVSKVVSYFSKYPAYKLHSVSNPAKGFRPKSAYIFRSFVPKFFGNFMPHLIYDKLFIRAQYPGMVALKKISDDQRSWYWHESF